MARSDRAFVFVDNHDNQRGHGGSGKLANVTRFFQLKSTEFVDSIRRRGDAQDSARVQAGRFVHVGSSLRFRPGHEQLLL